jgi:hypothetical protein
METIIATKRSGSIQTTATMIPTRSGLYRVTVIHRFFDSGNFYSEKPMENLSYVAAEGVLHYFTS